MEKGKVGGSIKYYKMLGIVLVEMSSVIESLLKIFYRSKISVIFLMTIFCTGSYATIPLKINHQGRLSDSQGTPLSGNYKMEFRIYDDPTLSDAGNLKWSEIQDPVNIINGVFNVLMGSNTAIGTDVFDGNNRYLEIWIGPSAGTTEKLSPRIQMVSNPYSYVSQATFAIFGTTVTSANIVDGTISTIDIANNAITPILVSTASYEHIRVGTATYTINAGTSAWATNAGLLNSYNSGNASGNIPVSNGTVNTNLNADMLDGKHYNAFITTSSAVGSTTMSTDLNLTYTYPMISFTDTNFTLTDTTGIFHIRDNYDALDIFRGSWPNWKCLVRFGFDSVNLISNLYFMDANNAFFTRKNVTGKFYWRNDAETNLMSLDNSGNLRSLGTMTASTTPDLSETIKSAGDIEPGDVVVVDPDNNEQVIKCNKRYDTTVVGVISDGSSSFLINSNAKNINTDKLTGKPLVLAGRVPVKVCDENGPINRGDLLTTSSIPGYAMKAKQEEIKWGTIIGKALEPLETGKGKIMVFLNLQ